jgi:hypothetical protein
MMHLDRPNPEDDEWMAAMRRGDFDRAWQISDAVLRGRIASGASSRHMPRHLQHVWTGTPLTGQRVLVRCYHGLGDTIQFIRFAAPLRDIAREVIVWAQPELLELVATARGVDRVLALHDGAPAVEYDVDIEIMELPHALRVTRDTVAPDVPYLFPASRQLLPLPAGFNVGIVWEAGGWDPRRSIPVGLMRHLRELRHLRFHSLQRGAAQSSAHEVTDSDVGSDDVLIAATRMLQLDLIISVDTMAAHLAGALGVPIWTLLHAHCDWRWMQTSHSVWYPTMRLFRQAAPGHWMPVIESVCTALTAINSADRTRALSVVDDTTN